MANSDNASVNSEKYSAEESVATDIYVKFGKVPRDEQDCVAHGVLICQVPESMRCSKIDVFIPHLVGLGPYHHSLPQLIMTDELKLGVVKRVLQDEHNRDIFLNLPTFFRCLHDYISSSGVHIQSLYQTDTDDFGNLLHLLIVDGLFLLAMLCTSDNYSTYILTGRRWEVPMLDDAGVELTTDGVMRDIFMLENQIPTDVLHLVRHTITNWSKFQSWDLGKNMKYLCQEFGPLVHSEKLSKSPEKHDHLLDLMYHLTAPKFEPQSQPESGRVSITESDLDYDFVPEIWQMLHSNVYGASSTAKLLILIMWTVQLFTCLFLFIWILLWACIYLLVITLQPILSLASSVILSVVPLLAPIFEQKKVKTLDLLYFLRSVIDIYQYYQSSFIYSLPFPNELRLVIVKFGERVIKVARGWFQKDSADFSYETVLSATELDKAGIQLKPVNGGISCVKLDEGTFTFYLPKMKLCDAISEVVIINLMAYESLVESNGLVFTSYIELMRTLTRTAEDVKLLVNKKIIYTRLNDEAVVQLFHGIPVTASKLTNNSKDFQKLREGIKKVKPRIDGIKNLLLIWTDLLRVLLILAAVVVFYPLTVKVFQQVACSTIFSPYLGLCN